MAYTVPPAFVHGDYPSAANLNILSADLVELHSLLAKINLPAAQISGGRGGVFINIYRWLHYRSIDGQTPTISDPAGINNSQTLPDAVNGVVTYDLANLSWLIPGRQYVLTGCLYALEDWEA